MEQAKDFIIQRLGDCTIPSPLSGVCFTRDEGHVLLHSDLDTIRCYLDAGSEPPKFETAGPREKIFFDPTKLACGIVTCEGLCPGLNDVIRSVVLSLHHHYGVGTIYGFPYGYEGLATKFGYQPIVLTPEVVAHISQMGGTMLGSSRGNQDVPVMVDTLERMGILLF